MSPKVGMDDEVLSNIFEKLSQKRKSREFTNSKAVVRSFVFRKKTVKLISNQRLAKKEMLFHIIDPTL